jgi:Zn finger protein HypA/HybF involved in hydrogenase expression
MSIPFIDKPQFSCNKCQHYYEQKKRWEDCHNCIRNPNFVDLYLELDLLKEQPQ